MSISGFFSFSSPFWNLLPRRDVSMKTPNSVKPASWGVTSNHFPENQRLYITLSTVIDLHIRMLLHIPRVMETWKSILSTLYSSLWETFFLYCTVNRIRVGSISVGLIRKIPQVQLIKHKGVYFFKCFCSFKFQMWHLMNNGCCSGTCFIIPAEVKTPQMSEREKYSSFVLSFNQARACSSSTPGSESLVTALSMLVLHCGSLYTEDMALLGKRRHLDPLLLSSTVLWWSEKDIILIHSSAGLF